MRKSAVILVIFALFAITLSAQEAEVVFLQQTLVEKGKTTPRLFVDIYSYVGESMGVWGTGYGEKQYASAVVGPFWDLATLGEDGVFQVGIAAGAEAFPDENTGTYRFYQRYAGFVYAGSDKLFSEIYYENGKSKEGWFRADLLWQAPGGRFSLGATHQTGDGTGPKLQYSVPESPFRIWVAPMFGEEESKLLVGIELAFQRK